MDGTIPWGTSPSRQVFTLAKSKWKQLHQGLTLALVGQPLALVPGLAGLYLVATSGGRLAARLDLLPGEATLLGWILVGGGLIGYLLLLAGTWRCLRCAPHGHGARDLQLACMLCNLVVPFCFAVSFSADGRTLYVALQNGPAGLLQPELLSTGPLFHLMGLASGLGGIFLFSAFARAISRCLNGSTRKATISFWVVAFLMGATVGLLLQSRQFSPRVVLPGLGLAWLLCLLWHVLLIHETTRRLGRYLQHQRPAAPPPAPDPVWDCPRRPGRVVLTAAHYLVRAE